THDDRRGDRSDAGLCLQTRSKFFGKQTQLVMVLAQDGGLLEHGPRQTASLTSCYCQRVACLQRAAGAPCGDGADLLVAQWLSGVDAQVDAAQERVQGVAVGGSLLVDDRAGCQQYP